MDLNNKSILFAGPLYNESDNEMLKYDVVIRTNNFFGINNRKSNRCDVLICNNTYSTLYGKVILENLDNVKIIYVTTGNGKKLMIREMKKQYRLNLGLPEDKVMVDDIEYQIFLKKLEKIYILPKYSSIRTFCKKKPLLLIRVLEFLIHDIKFKSLFVDGLDFYYKQNSLDGYRIVEEKNQLQNTIKNHDIEGSKSHLKHVIKKYKKISTTDFIKEIIGNE